MENFVKHARDLVWAGGVVLAVSGTYFTMSHDIATAKDQYKGLQGELKQFKLETRQYRAGRQIDRLSIESKLTRIETILDRIDKRVAPAHNR